jgi:hypothetical protein
LDIKEAAVKKKIVWVFLVACFFVIAASPILIRSQKIDWWAIGPSSKLLKTGNTELTSVIGQSFSGVVTQDGSELCTGYLCLWQEFLRLIFMPLIRK